MQDPLKQGLKLIYLVSKKHIIRSIRMQDPLKQGLKPVFRSEVDFEMSEFECKIH